MGERGERGEREKERVREGGLRERREREREKERERASEREIVSMYVCEKFKPPHQLLSWYEILVKYNTETLHFPKFGFLIFKNVESYVKRCALQENTFKLYWNFIVSLNCYKFNIGKL